MTIDELDALMAESTRQFNDLKVREGANEEEHTQIETTLHRYQGEYEAYRKIKLKLLEPADPAILLPDPFKAKADKKDTTDASK